MSRCEKGCHPKHFLIYVQVTVFSGIMQYVQLFFRGKSFFLRKQGFPGTFSIDFSKENGSNRLLNHVWLRGLSLLHYA